MAQSVVGGSARLIGSIYGIDVPASGFDVDSWMVWVDQFFPTFEDSPLIVDFLMMTAPDGADSEILALLRSHRQEVSRVAELVSY